MKKKQNDDDIIESGVQLTFPINDSDKFMYKSNNLTESNYILSLNEQRLILLGIKKLRPKYVNTSLKPSQLKTLAAKEEFSTIRIYVNEFKETFNLNSNNMYSVLEKTANSLFNRYFPYKEDDGTYGNKRWVITCGYNRKERFVELVFHPDLILDLLIFSRDRQYNKSNFNNYYELTGSYSFRIFELLNNYAYTGERIFELEDFRKKIGLEDKKYKRFSELNRSVIKPTIEELNEKTDLSITYTVGRKGRTVNSLIFKMSKKALTSSEVKEQDVRASADIERTRELLKIDDLSISEANRIIDSAICGIRNNHLDVSFQDYLLEKVSELNKYKEENLIKDYISLLSSFLLKNSFYDKKRRLGDASKKEEKKKTSTKKKVKEKRSSESKELIVKDLVPIDDLSTREIERIITATNIGIQAIDNQMTFSDYLKSKVKELEEYKIENDIDDYISLLCAFLKKNSKYDKKRSYTSNQNKNSFNNFEGRSYDYAELEKKLLGLKD